jgi:hypothetical protein
MLASNSLFAPRRRRVVAFALLLASGTACQRQLPVVDDGPIGAAGRGSMAEAAQGTGAARANPQPTACKDKGPAQFIRPHRDDSFVTELAAAGDDVFFSAVTKSNLFTVRNTEDVIFKLSSDGQERLFYSPDPPVGVRSLLVSGDTLFFTAIDSANKTTVSELPLSGGGKAKSLYSFGEQESGNYPVILAADSAYVYVHVLGFANARISRSDGTRSPLPFSNYSNKIVTYANKWYYMVYPADSNTDPLGLYQFDPAVATATAVLLGKQSCGLGQDWVLTSDAVFCETPSGIVSFDPRATGATDKAPVYKLNPGEGQNVNVGFSRADGEFVYFRASLDPDHKDRPIRRLDMRSRAVDAISCARKETDSIVGTRSFVYWIESRMTEDDTSKDGIYRVAKP